jgi:hypothetical protein
LIDLHTTKKKKQKKEIFGLGKGGGPLKGTPPLSDVSQKRLRENS